MQTIMRSLWSYHKTLYKRWSRVDHNNQWKWIEEQSGLSLANMGLKRWSQYLSIIELMDVWKFSNNKPLSIEDQTKLNLALSAFIPLYDDFTDDYLLKHEDIMLKLLLPVKEDEAFKIAGFLLDYILTIHPNGNLFLALLEKGGEAQNRSLKQKNNQLNSDELMQVTWDKGGYFTLLCFSGFYGEFNSSQFDYFFELGALFQLLNDTFDVYKDLQENVTTLPNSIRSADQLEKLYADKLISWLKSPIPWQLDQADVKLLKGQLSLLFATGFICIDQYKKLQNSKGEFIPSCHSRKELICDMDSIAQVWKVVKRANRLIKM